MPIIKAISPFGADAPAINAFRNAVKSMGQESVMQLPQSAEPQFGKYDLEFLEASDQAWQGFPGLIEQCNTEITLAFQGQSLTTEVKEGSLAAARVHGDVRQAVLKAKARAFERTIYTQITRPFAAINYGDPEIAPRTEWDLDPYEDNLIAADTFKSIAAALASLKLAGIQVHDVPALARSMGLNLSMAQVETLKIAAPVSAPPVKEEPK